MAGELSTTRSGEVVRRGPVATRTPGATQRGGYYYYGGDGGSGGGGGGGIQHRFYYPGGGGGGGSAATTEPPDLGGRPKTFIMRLGSLPPHKEVPVKTKGFKWLGNQRIIVIAWAVAMATISVDEWNRNGILPRPSRLFWATLFYGMLGIVSYIDVLLPLCNVLAIGYSIMLIWQYYNKTGQFAPGA